MSNETTNKPIPAEADHHIVCECRCHLSDALRAMLREGYMTTPDWEIAQRHTQAALQVCIHSGAVRNRLALGPAEFQRLKGATMRDRDVREALHRKVLKEHHGDTNTLVLDELGLRHGTCRVDIAVVSGHLHGYEIKSDQDTLDRLPSQVEIYGAVLDRATLVVGERHVEKAKAKIPNWWGIKVVISGPRGGINFENVRPIKTNPNINAVALAELLWRPEAVEILRELGTSEVILRKPRAFLYRYLAETVDLDDLRGLVRQRLKGRATWRGHRPSLLDVDLSIPTPTLTNCP